MDHLSEYSYAVGTRNEIGAWCDEGGLNDTDQLPPVIPIGLEMETSVLPGRNANVLLKTTAK
jgi:hypothetical protein